MDAALTYLGDFSASFGSYDYVDPFSQAVIRTRSHRFIRNSQVESRQGYTLGNHIILLSAESMLE